MESSHLDCLAVQKLFGVRERRAWQLMAGLPGPRSGNASAVLRHALIARLEERAAGGRFQWETNRRARVVDELDRTRRQLAARRVRIPAVADVEDRRLRDLSGDIALKPGELRIGPRSLRNCRRPWRMTGRLSREPSNTTGKKRLQLFGGVDEFAKGEAAEHSIADALPGASSLAAEPFGQRNDAPALRVLFAARAKASHTVVRTAY